MTEFRSDPPGAVPQPPPLRGRIYVYSGMTFEAAVALIEAERLATNTEGATQ